MIKKVWLAAAAAVMTVFLAGTALAAPGSWESNGRGWWWQRDDGSYPVNSWRWIDGNGDGIAECYHFDEDGYLDSNTYVDGSYVDMDGAWSDGGNKYTRSYGIDETARIAGSFASLPAVNPELYGRYKMQTELVDSYITIDRGEGGLASLTYACFGYREDGSIVEEIYNCTLQDTGENFEGTHHYVADEVTHSGDMITFDWAPGMPWLDSVEVNGEYMYRYERMAE